MSRGFCLLLFACALPAQTAPLSVRVMAALDRARKVLLEELRDASAGQLALLSLAALHDGVPPGDPILEGALRRLSGDQMQDTYGPALRLMVMAECEGFPNRKALIPLDTATLLQHQHGGGFSYASRGLDWDLSNTQYAALGLRAAEAMGHKVPDSKWLSLLRAVEAAQGPDGGFGYTANAGAHGSYASMTMAGIAVLQICKARLHQGRKDPPEDKGIAAAWEWMERHVREISQPTPRWPYYFLYGLERAAILSDVTKVGGTDWYEAGAEHLLARQDGGGGWSGSSFLRRPGALRASNPVDTAFAVLFLARKFRKDPVTTAGGYLSRGLPEQATEREIDAAARVEVTRGISAVPDLLKALRSRMLPRRKAAAKALREISGRDFGIDPEKDPEQCAEALERAERWWLTEGTRR